MRVRVPSALQVIAREIALVKSSGFHPEDDRFETDTGYNNKYPRSSVGLEWGTVYAQVAGSSPVGGAKVNVYRCFNTKKRSKTRVCSLVD